MLLAVDARNRSTVAGFLDGRTWLGQVRLGTDRTADELAFALEAAGGRIPGSPVDEAWISSVVPAATPRLVEAVRTAFGVDASVVGPGTRTGVRIRTDIPSEVGSDIVCSAAAARELCDGASIIVDFGTAIVLTAVDSGGDLLGVSIAPGLETAVAALRASTAQMPDVRLEMPKRAIGRSTVQSVQSGVLLGFGGLVERLVGLMQAEMGVPAEVLGTGDALGRAVLSDIGLGRFEPDLVLRGLAAIAGRNRRAVD